MIDHGHPHCHIHEVEMMDHVKRSIAASYTSLLSRIDNHIEDNRVHVSVEEKDTWNNKADKTQIRDLEMRLMEKADYCDVIELKEILAKIKAKVENTSNSDSSDNDDYITESELERALSELRELINNIHVEDTDLTGYATEEWVTAKLGGYALLSKFNDYYTKDQINNMLSNIQPQQPDLSGYIKNTDVLFTFNNRSIKKGDSITVSTDPTQPTVTGLTADQIKFTQDSRVPVSGDGSYKIGDLKVADTLYPIYGKDYVGTGGGQTGNDGGYYEIAFKAFDKDATLSTVQSNMPTNGIADLGGWSHSAENNDGSKSVWMINRYVSGDGAYGAWLGPWMISGANGENGVDGDKIEYVYTRTVTEELTDAQLNALNVISQEDDYIPSGWFDNPQGVNQDSRFEWMAFRTKTFTRQNPEGTWSRFIGPVLWSAYGRNGTDGDGIEYIFCAKPDGETYTSDPSTWAVSQEREHIPSNVSEWTDDPVNIETLGKGARQWVSIRKKYADIEGAEPVWHEYSAPALWSYYAKDGQVGGIVQAVQYSIQPKASSVIVSYGEQEDSVSGTIQWTVTRSEGTNITLVGPSNEYNVTSRVTLGERAYSGFAYSDGTYSVTLQQEYTGSEKFMEIVAYENNTPVASTIIPVIIPGRDGQNGEDGNDAELQALNLEVLRVRVWNENHIPAYNDGTVIEDGVKYLDIVEHNGNYYKCLTANTNEVPGQPKNEADPDWTMLTGMGNAWFDTMIANNAYIKSITAKQIVVTSDATSSTEGEVPVAGMLNGTIIPTQLTGKTNTNGIRIFAGNIPSNGDVSDAPFTVDNNGKLKANNAEIRGKITATSGTFDNCIINDTCTIKGIPIPASQAIMHSDIDENNYVFLEDSLPDGSICNVIVLGASVRYPIRVFSKTVKIRAYSEGSWSYMDNHSWAYWDENGGVGELVGYISRVDLQAPGIFTFIKYDGMWYVMLTYAE